MTKLQAAQAKAQWLSQCLDFGWQKSDLDGLSEVWDKFKDENGNMRKKHLPTPSSGVNPHEQILQLLITGGFLDPGKLKEARDIIGKCESPSSLTKEEIAQICEMADNDYAAQEAIMFAEFLRKKSMRPDGFGGWGGGDINTNYYGSTEIKLYELFKKYPVPLSIINPESFLKALREGNPYDFKSEHDYDKWRWNAYANAVQKAKELLNQSI